MKLLMTILVLLLSPLISSARPLLLPKPTPNPKDHSPKHTDIIAKSNNQWDFLQQLVGCCHAAGQRHYGLAQLKHHFHRLGYIISNSPSTDEFDDELHSAIRTYQHNFNLDVTGQLDSQTLDHITQPRCGNPDIISGSTSSHDDHHHRHQFHILSHYSFYDGMPSWKGRKTLTYGFSSTHKRSPLNNVGVPWVFGLAFDQWSRVIPLNFTKVDNALTADIVIASHSLDGPGGMLGNVYAPQHGEITMDADEDWLVIDGYEDTTSLPLPIDLLSVAVHEIGHALGLMHSTDIESVMYPIYPVGVSKATLSKDDIEGIQHLYGKNPNYHAVPSSTSSQRHPELDIKETSKTIING